jgi:hypothetical protein
VDGLEGFMIAGETAPTASEEFSGAIPQSARRERVQYVRLGPLPEENSMDHLLHPDGVPCYEAIFEGGRIRILADGLDLAATEAELMQARAEERRPHILVGKLTGIGPDGAPRLTVGYAVPLFGYTIHDVELLTTHVPAGHLQAGRPDRPKPGQSKPGQPKRRDIRIAA